MKKTSLLFCIFFSIVCFAQNNSEKVVKRIENKLYIVENGVKYNVDETKIIAKLKPHRELPNHLRGNIKDLGFEILEIITPDNIRVEDFVSHLKSTGDYEFVDYNSFGSYLFSVNDNLIDDQWYLDRIEANNAWNITTGSSLIKVAVLDSGVDSCHYDLHYGSDNYTHLDIPNGYNYPEDVTYSAPLYYHGTMVSGILGAKSNNNIGIAGISGGNNNAGITILPFCVGNYEPSTDYVISAINRAIEKGAKIMNMSFSFPVNEGVINAINIAYNQGITIICSSGNDNTSLSFPASHPYTIAVGATNKTNQRASFSNYGNGLDLVAPGVDIKSTVLNNGYNSNGGTSFSAPQVVGVASLMLSVNPTLTPSQIRTLLWSTCKKIPNYTYNSSGWNQEVGYGLLDAYAAVKVANSSIIGKPVICDTANYVINGLPSDYTISWSIDNSNYAITPSGNQCFVTYTGTPQYSVANLTATVTWNGTTINTLTKRIVMHGTDMSVTGFQYGDIISPNGLYPERHFTIPSNNRLLLSKALPDRSSIDSIFDKESLPIDFVEVQSPGNPVDVCGYGFTEINGGNDVYLNSTRFDGMDLSFSGSLSPIYLNRNGSDVAFKMPYYNNTYYTKLLVHSESECHDFCLMFKVVPLPGAASGDDIIWLNYTGSMLYVFFGSTGEPIGNGQIYLPSYTVTISKIPVGTQMYSHTFPGSQNSFSVNTSGWASGIYSIRIVQGNNIYTKTIYI